MPWTLPRSRAYLRIGTSYPGAGIRPGTDVYVSYTLVCVPYRWLEIALASLRGIEPHEVLQALAGARRLVAPSVGTDIALVGIFARTEAGRPIAVALRRAQGLDWWIVGARDMTADERKAFEAWEAGQ
jgi:hypothetical protein